MVTRVQLLSWQHAERLGHSVRSTTALRANDDGARMTFDSNTASGKVASIGGTAVINDGTRTGWKRRR
ncbi:hypothetical protein E2562_023977 [Oryza meyeriana var. granulata]|uniref:Uncharacterized protein n=1 Tax=Oryza meyeriana var. granulata TaxID=110450 RepID=A0A6G1C051_9ORYZ|nr:hypothetical protein E2562_023977 [Oryza meyeriana var. granulata]